MATHIVTHNELKNAINYYIINRALQNITMNATLF
jgi:hypothetical protein